MSLAAKILTEDLQGTYCSAANRSTVMFGAQLWGSPYSQSFLPGKDKVLAHDIPSKSLTIITLPFLIGLYVV
jgi:hypothetical protein